MNTITPKVYVKDRGHKKNKDADLWSTVQKISILAMSVSQEMKQRRKQIGTDVESPQDTPTNDSSIHMGSIVLEGSSEGL